jgi:O-antigen chain-terminating methyltransferase
VSSEVEHPALENLRARLDEEEAAYGDVLAAVDRLAEFALPAEAAPEIHDRLERLNSLWAAPERPASGGLGGALRQRAWDAVAPALERQTEFNAALVQLLNAYLAQSDRIHARLRELSSALARYAQRVQPLVDARDRVATALATTRSELVLESFDRRLESLARRLAGLLALRDGLETISAEVRAVHGSLVAAAPPPSVAAAAARAAKESVSRAFASRFRDRTDGLLRRLPGYVERFGGCAPVVELGCGRGDFLEAMRSAGVAARGVDGDAGLVRECRERGLDVVHGDAAGFLRAQADGSLGGVFAAQVADHLPPSVLADVLTETHRTLRPAGLLVLEAVNPRSVTGLLEVFNRDLAHERPMHPDSLRFLAAAAGFTDVEVELLSPVPEDARLQPVPIDGLPPRAAAALNENLERLNGLLYGPLEYALVARR